MSETQPNPRTMAPPPPPTDLIEDAIAEIFLRLPPDEPEHLFRAALVSKPWLRILCDPGFLRRYRAFHGAPPLLGFLHIHYLGFSSEDPFPGFVSTTSVPAFAQPAGTDSRSTRILDCRHGRVLLHGYGDMWNGDRGYRHLVWDPVTGDSHALPPPPKLFTIRRWRCSTTAVSCDAQGCKHLDCHGGPFRVAFVAAEGNTIFAIMYTSEAGAWSTPTSVSISSKAYLLDMPGAVIGDEVHFALEKTNTFTTVNYDWGKKCLSVMKSPSPLHPEVWNGHYNLALMAMEDSSPALAACVDSSLYIYSRKVNTDGAARWVRCRVIDLEKVIPMAKPCDGYRASVSFAEGVGAMSVHTSVGLFTIKLKSGRVKKVAEPGAGFKNYFSVLPYMSFYTPDRGTLSSLITSGAPYRLICLSTARPCDIDCPSQVHWWWLLVELLLSKHLFLHSTLIILVCMFCILYESWVEPKFIRMR